MLSARVATRENSVFATTTSKALFTPIHNALFTKLRCNGYDMIRFAED
jgi:hypothetical protein